MMVSFGAIALPSMACVLGSYYDELYSMDENYIITFLIEKYKLILYVIKAYLFNAL
jgi:hypothetical protein